MKDNTKQLDFLKSRISKLEDTKEVLIYKKYLSLSEEERESIKTKWSEYYDQCKLTPSYQRYEKAKQALRENRIGDLKELVAQDIPNKLKKPSSIDPDELARTDTVRMWWQTKEKLESLYESSKDIERARGVFS